MSAPSEGVSNGTSIFSFPESGFERLGYISVGGLCITSILNVGIIQILATVTFAGMGLYAINRIANPHTSNGKKDSILVSIMKDIENCCCRNKKSTKGLAPDRITSRTVNLQGADVSITRTGRSSSRSR